MNETKLGRDLISMSRDLVRDFLYLMVIAVMGCMIYALAVRCDCNTRACEAMEAKLADVEALLATDTKVDRFVRQLKLHQAKEQASAGSHK